MSKRVHSELAADQQAHYRPSVSSRQAMASSDGTKPETLHGLPRSAKALEGVLVVVPGLLEMRAVVGGVGPVTLVTGPRCLAWDMGTAHGE